jgi:hypothetical protein
VTAGFHRTIALSSEARDGEVVRCTGGVDDHFHGFDVELDVHDGQVVGARAHARKQPWTTCGGALPSVARLSGPLEAIADQIHDAPRDTTCVHVSDLVALTARAYSSRRYEVDAEPTHIRVERDGEVVVDWALDRWTVREPGPYEGFWFSGHQWSEALDARDAGDDEREAVFVARRGILVAIGYYELPWDTIDRGSHIGYDVMTGSCHTFTEPHLSVAVSLVEVPRLS